ncbi:MAG: hypothetical protein V3V97_13085 [Hyphomicrobiaceae bacterium]
MRNLFAVLLAIIVFTATVVIINTQGGGPEAAFSFDIRDAVERLEAMLTEQIAFVGEDHGIQVPGMATITIAAFGLSLPALFAYTLFGRIRR